ncbi:hypothetical protein CC666_23150 [Salmonella enterica subsp. enterica serovar Panama]|nr:hypothetical protein [Salmonella enterica subsp. enterica serovar Panama]
MNGKELALVAFLPAVSVASGTADILSVTDITGQASSGMYLSADGRVVAGAMSAEDGAFRMFWSDGEQVLSPGSLKTDLTGNTVACGLSADGRTVVGRSDGDNGVRAFVYTAGQAGLTDTGTLKADNTGSAIAYGLSADGQVVVGTAESDSGGMRAFRYPVSGTGMTDLGTLAPDNSGSSV